MSNKSKVRCAIEQKMSNIKYTRKIAKEMMETLDPTYCCRKEDYESKQDVFVDFWLCWDDIECCVKGSKRKWGIDLA